MSIAVFRFVSIDVWARVQANPNVVSRQCNPAGSVWMKLIVESKESCNEMNRMISQDRGAIQLHYND